ncbi:hypothetical protein HD806DRAFT_350678 [Xylariaceae sp. AK1471]|nr:hypothetical protein HD806DRAFT_350678 [Xylariaceae sp. AK1471]
MKSTPLVILASALGVLVGAVPMGGDLKRLNEQVCARAGACGHHIDCTELWLSCNLKLLMAGRGGSSGSSARPDLGYMIPWWYEGMGTAMEYDDVRTGRLL